MNELQRFDIWAGIDGIEYVTDSSGEWVKYEDVKELEEEIGNHKAENEAIGTLVSELEEENERLKDELLEVQAQTVVYVYSYLASRGVDLKEIELVDVIAEMRSNAA